MTSSTGFDFDVLISRLHGGMRDFQSLRAHRRERHREETPQPRAPDPVTPPPVPTASEPAPPKLEPQGFVRFGGQVFPLFDAVTPQPAAPQFTAPPVVAQPAEPPAAPQFAAPPVAPSLTQEAVPVAEVPRSAPAATLKLPPPTPPAGLGLVPSMPAPRPAASPPNATAKAPPATDAGLDARASDEAVHLAQVHAEHRLHLARLLDEHRAELDARAAAEAARTQADAARTTQVLRDLLAEHRAELDARAAAEAARMTQVLRDVLAEHRAEQARAAEVHAEALAAALARPRASEPTDPADPLRTALTEQATRQRETNEELAQHITTLTTIVADIGQTVGLLAMATFDGKQNRLPMARPTFAPPPRPATLPDPPSSDAAPTRTTPVPAEPAIVARPDASTSTCNSDPPTRNFLRDAPKPAHLRAVAAARDRERIQALMDEVADEELVDTPDEDEDHVRLAPITPEAQVDG